MTLWFSDSAWKINFPLFAEAMIIFQQFAEMRDTDANSKKRGIIGKETISHGNDLFIKEETIEACLTQTAFGSLKDEYFFYKKKQFQKLSQQMTIN